MAMAWSSALMTTLDIGRWLLTSPPGVAKPPTNEIALAVCFGSRRI
jgi:hypothetical protein